MAKSKPGKSKSRHAAKVNRTPKPKVRKPRPQTLGGMEDGVIQPLEDAAHRYAEIRDERMVLSKEEGDLKSNLLGLMHKYGKKLYNRDGIAISVIEEAESVKVRIKKAKDDDDDSSEAGDGAGLDE